LHRNELDAGGWQGASGERARAYLQRFLQAQSTNLQKIICGYVARMGLAKGSDIEDVAAEVLQETALEAMSHAERFQPDEMQPRAWLLGIATNVLKRYRAKYARRYRFEVLTGTMAQEPDLLDQLLASPENAPGPEQAFIAHEGLHELLALVSADDARLLQMALVQGWNANELAAMMGITPGTARVRIHRALTRLREAWRQATTQRKGNQKRHG
jgi:RNA polymerase sigma-70 factor (ECF subfamily)